VVPQVALAGLACATCGVEIEAAGALFLFPGGVAVWACLQCSGAARRRLEFAGVRVVEKSLSKLLSRIESREMFE
jgi:hypothetical protein